MPDLPSTADTVTGTSNTASRSCEVRLVSASLEPSAFSSAADCGCGSSWPRSGRSTSSLSAMGQSSVSAMGAVSAKCRAISWSMASSSEASARSAPPPRHSMRQSALAQCGVGGDLHAAVEAFCFGDFGDAVLQGFGHVGAGAQGDARLADGLVHGLAQGLLDLGCGKGGQRRARQLARRGQRDGGRMGAQRFDLVRRAGQRLAQRLGGFGSRRPRWLRARALRRPWMPSACASAFSASISAWLKLWRLRARAVSATTSLTPSKTVSNVNFCALISRPARLRPACWRS